MYPSMDGLCQEVGILAQGMIDGAGTSRSWRCFLVSKGFACGQAMSLVFFGNKEPMGIPYGDIP